MKDEKKCSEEQVASTTPKGSKFKKNKKNQKFNRKPVAKPESNEKVVTFKPGNDFSWWNKIPELLADSTNFKSNYIAGTQISADAPYVVPGVLEVKLISNYFACVSPTDPVNVWARDLYLRMFQKYRPASGYTASDLGITIISALEAVKLFALYERIYGIINRYSVRNVNMPLIEAEALNLTPATVAYLQSHMSDFRYDLNYLSRKAQRLCIPKDISFIAQAISLFGYEFLDHDSPRGQIIVFNLDKYGLYEDTALSAGGAIQFSGDIATDLFDFNADNMCKALNLVLDRLLNSDSVQRIFADLVVWFGSDAMLQFLPVPEDYMVVPVYSEEILHELHNLETADTNGLVHASFIDNQLSTTDQGVVGNGNYWVYQVDDRIVTLGTLHQPTSTTPAPTSFHGYIGKILTTTVGFGCVDRAHILDGYQDVPDPEFVLEGTMFKAAIELRAPAAGVYAGVIHSSISYIVRDVTLHDTTPGTLSPLTVLAQTAATAQATAGQLALIDWAPLSYCCLSYDSLSSIYGDLDVIIPLDRTNLSRIQRTAFLSGIHTDVNPIKG